MRYVSGRGREGPLLAWVSALIFFFDSKMWGGGGGGNLDRTPLNDAYRRTWEPLYGSLGRASLAVSRSRQ